MDTKTPENSTQTPTLVIKEIEKKPRKKRESKKKPPTFTITREPVIVSFK